MILLVPLLHCCTDLHFTAPKSKDRCQYRGRALHHHGHHFCQHFGLRNPQLCCGVMIIITGVVLLSDSLMPSMWVVLADVILEQILHVCCTDWGRVTPPLHITLSQPCCLTAWASCCAQTQATQTQAYTTPQVAGRQQTQTETSAACLQVYSAQKASKLVLWVAVGVACFFGVLAVVLLTAPLWDKRHGRDPETGVEDNGQQEPFLAPDMSGGAAAAAASDD